MEIGDPFAMLQKSVSEILLRWLRGRKKDSRKRKGAEPYRDIYQIQPPIPAWQFTSSCWKKGFPRT